MNLFPQLYRLHRVALQVDALKLLNIADRKNLAHHLETERIFTKQQILCSAGESEAVVAEFFDVHFRIQDSGFRIQDSGFRIQDSGSKFV